MDLTPALLEVARQRVQPHGWSNVTLVQADATTFRPEGLAADVVTFSYALTMIPEWFAAVDHAASSCALEARLASWIFM